MASLNSLRPVGGSFYGHLFENRYTGVPLGIYWNFIVEFEPLIDDDGDEWPCSASFDWMSWPVRSWHKLEGCSLETSQNIVGPEVSLYAYSRHQPATHADFALTSREDARFWFNGWLQLDLEDLEGDVTEGLKIQISVPLEFTGLIVVPGSLDHKPQSDIEVTRALADFAETSEYKEPAFDEMRWLFHPRI